MMQAPATCGELVQGSLDEVPCLVSCPIDLWSSATVALRGDPGWAAPDDAPKAAQAIAAGAALLGHGASGGILHLDSAIPRGRGYGSSTADIVAALAALGEALGRPLPPHEIAAIAVVVEPTDSVMFPGLALFDHRRGTLHEALGDAPDMAIIVLDPGGTVDTVSFNQRDLAPALRRLAPDHRQAFDLLRSGVRQSDLPAIGAAATLSAQLHQRILHNQLLGMALELADNVGACGVCRAHSGTILGLLLDPAACDVAGAARYVREHAPGGVAVRLQHLVGGGARSHKPTDTRRML